MLVEIAEYITNTCYNNMQGFMTKKDIIHEIIHIQQSDNWDCGLACVLMALRASGNYICNERMFDHLCEIQSIWTIDLAYLLRFSGAVVVFTTTKIGANPDYANVDYYVDKMTNDESRVNYLFEEALNVGIPVLLRSISLKNLKELILTGLCIIIVLVDLKILHKSSAFDSSSDMKSHINQNTGYIGHYVVLCGYDNKRNEFLIHDPGSDNKSGYWIESNILHEARTSYGTDEDLLIIGLHKNSTVTDLLKIIKNN